MRRNESLSEFRIVHILAPLSAIHFTCKRPVVLQTFLEISKFPHLYTATLVLHFTFMLLTQLSVRLSLMGLNVSSGGNLIRVLRFTLYRTFRLILG
jgi:hypothetical protein